MGHGDGGIDDHSDPVPPQVRPTDPAHVGVVDTPRSEGSTDRTGATSSRIAFVAFSVLAVLAGGTFAFAALNSSDGAATPEEAVQGLFDALDREDAIGVMESLPPGERGVLLDPMVATVGELQRLGLLDSFELDDVPGADIEVDGLALSSTPLGEGVTKVRITGGTITGTVIPDGVPIGPKARELAEREGDGIRIEPESGTESLADAELELVTIEEGGGWHVSLFYSVAESIRGDDHPVPQFGADIIAPIGADTPEGAVSGMFDAALDLDLAAVVGHLPPDEMRVAYDYAPLFLADADEAAAEIRAEGFSASLDRLELDSSGGGDTRQVTVTALDLRMDELDEVSMHYRWDGTCTDVEVTSPYWEDWSYDSGTPQGDQERTSTTRMEVCTDGRASMTEDGEDVDMRGYPGGTTVLPFGSGATFGQTFTVVEHHGRWYVSPLGTMFDSLLTALEGIEPSDIDEFFDSWGGWLGTSSSMEYESIESTGTTWYDEDTDDPALACAQVFEVLGVGATDEEVEAARRDHDDCLAAAGIGAPGAQQFVRLGAPRFAGGHVVVPTTQGVDGYDLDGVVAWVGPECEAARWATPHEPSVAVDVAVLGCLDEMVGVDAGDGEELWRIPFPDAERIRLGPVALVVARWGETQVLDVRTGELLWSVPSGNADTGGSDAERVYVGTDDDLSAHDPVTGAELWSAPFSTMAIGLHDGVLVTRDHERVVRRLDPATGAVLWTSVADNEHLAGSDVVAFTDDTVILVGTVSPRSYVSYDLGTGEQLWVRPLPDATGRISADGTTVISTFQGSAVHHDPRTGAAQAAIQGLPTDIVGVAVDDGHLAVVGCIDDVGVVVVLPAP